MHRGDARELPIQTHHADEGRAGDLIVDDIVDLQSPVFVLRMIMSVSPGMLLKLPKPMTCQFMPTAPRTGDREGRRLPL